MGTVSEYISEALSKLHINSDAWGVTTTYEGKCVLIFNPYGINGPNTYKGQLHCHTNLSDGANTPVELVTAYKNAGYDFITITDHDIITPDPEVEGITWLGTSVEESQQRHVNAFNVTAQSTDTNTQDIINFHRANNTLCSLNHPNWNQEGGQKPSLESEIVSLYDYNLTEIYNGTTGTYAEEQWDFALSAGRKVFALAVDDCHSIAGIDFNKGWVLVKAAHNTDKDILEALRNGNFYSSTGNTLSITVSDNEITANCPNVSDVYFIGKNGRILKSEAGVNVSSYTIKGDEAYVRVKAVATGNSASIAWSQPIFVDVIGENDQNIAKLNKLASMDSFSKQALINGNFDIWQRGVSFTDPANASYTADRWKIAVSADGGVLPTRTVTREDLASGEIPRSTHYYRHNTNGAGTSLGAGSFCQLQQFVEKATSLLAGLGKKVTLKFYARSSIANKKIGLELQQNYGTGGSPSASENIIGETFTLTSAWEQYSHTFPTNTLKNKVFGTDNNDTMRVTFWLMWGDNFKTRVGASVAETFCGSGNIDIAQVRLSSGDIEFEFSPKSFAEELHDCQRFYEKSYDYAVAPGTATAVGNMRDVAISTNNFYDNGRLRYLVPKYKAPTVHLYSPVTGAIDRIRNAVDSADVSAYNIADIGESGLWITSDDAGLLVNKGYCWHYTLDSDI